MSAYALPGLFPPIETNHHQPSAASCCTGDSSETMSKSSAASPLHQERQDECATRGEGICQEEGVARLSRASADEKSTPQAGRAIAVKEAKIDPVRLIQSVTSTSSQSQQQQQSRRKTLKRRSLGSDPSCPNSPNKSMCSSPHEEAIQFELAISFNGRRYTATRTLNAIFQLRDDLIREMNNQNRWMHTRQFGKTVNKDDKASFDIPEIPPMTEDDNGSSGFVGRGFTMLHNALTCYVPTIEHWLRNVMTIVPQESECLSNFLWEPLSKEDSIALARSCSSLRSLGSIPELSGGVEHETDEEWE